MLQPKLDSVLLLKHYYYASVLLFLAIVNVNGTVIQSAFQENEVLKLQEYQWKLKSNSYTNSSTCISQKSRWENGATVLEMKHKDSCSASGKIADWNKKLQKSLILDKLRVQSLQSRIQKIISGNSVNSVDSQIPLISGIRLQTLNYIVTVELGGQNMTMIVDTGSDLTWVQCQPCRLCYNQKDPLFNPSRSSSYQKILCNSSTCQSLEYATGNVGVCGTDTPTCNYIVNYGDGSYTRGELGIEQLSFGKIPVRNFVFGCGRNNKGLFGGASGLMGLGRSDLSLISQTSAIFEGVFSYCLPTTASDSSGSLVLGGNTNSSVYKNITPISYTRMIVNPQLPTFYFLNLTGVSIGGVALQASGFGRGGILIDSGTVITRLPPALYSVLKTEFLKQFSRFPTAPPFSILDSCFNLSGYEEVDVPTIKFQFEGNAEMIVDVTGIFYFVKTDASQVCLALASLSFDYEIPIIGNYQQRNLRVVYDTKESRLGFAAEACNFN
ncbi:aspartyl protease family protein At5g10770 [Mercurialis annua]|uniref:aspartyl protease family protein At5g10770 n=1 Tax=Mercurialis annua TaxID=3986 RepID=UPI0021606236|nr:aspartyl protease family protein At5g10770 [Mercurialis annua]